MELINRLKNFISNLEEKESYKYILASIGILFLLLALLAYFYYSKINKYNNELKRINTQRQQTRKILGDYKSVNQQQFKVEEILAQDPNFRISQAYKDIIQKSGLTVYQQDEPTRAIGESVDNKTEITLTSHLTGISMKQLTELLSNIANIIRLYPKDLTIKKSPKAQAIDVDLTIATLEPASTPE